MRGIDLVNSERNRQINEHDYSSQHDDKHTDGQLGRAGLCYAEKGVTEIEGVDIDWPHAFWPEGWELQNEETSIEYLIKGAALLVAEIDRLLREAGEYQ